MTEPSHVLEGEVGRVGQIDVGLRGAVDDQQPTGGPVGVELDRGARGYS
jgi:hypothetical protein